jgi:hypothetical protein
MSPYTILGLSLLAVLAAVILAFAFAPRKRRPGSGEMTDLYKPFADGCYVEGDTVGGYGGYRDGGLVAPRTVGKNPALGAGYPAASRSFGSRPSGKVFLTPRQIERVNIQRRLAGRPPFNRKGLTSAIAHPFNRADVRQPQSSNDWLSYLIMYEIIAGDHQGHTVSGCGGVTIDTDAPYNGHGGEYAGGGASGDWSDNSTRATAAAIDHGIGIVGEPETASNGAGRFDDAGGPAMAPSDPAYSAPSVSDSASSYSSTPDPTPSYTPDPTPSYTPDPSPSFDSGSSSSFDAGSN